MELTALYQVFQECQSVTTDSRNCPDGSLFIALKGESFNGNAFAEKALKSGCAYAIVDEAGYAVEGDRRYILVDDCLQTMQQLANYHRRQLGTVQSGRRRHRFLLYQLQKRIPVLLRSEPVLRLYGGPGRDGLLRRAGPHHLSPAVHPPGRP